MRHLRFMLILTLGCVVVSLACTSCSTGPSVNAMKTASPTSTRVAETPTPSALYQSTLQSPLSGWPQTANTFAASDGYHIVGGYLVFAPVSDQTDVSISVEVKQISGATQADYGVAFRHTQNNRYEFDINSSGSWYVLKDVNTNHTNLVNLTHNSAIHTGLNVTNTLKVEAQGPHFIFFVNGVLVGQIDDATHPTGQIGLDGDNNAEVVFTNLQVSALP